MAKRMHCEEQLRIELDTLVDSKDSICDMFKYWGEGYSTSAHLEIMYKICCGLRAKKVGEIGVGRSSFVLYEYCKRHGAKYICCDRYDYHYLFKIADMSPDYLHGDASYFYKSKLTKGLDFLFLDYFSTGDMSAHACYKDMKKALKLMKTNGIIAVHDVLEDRYNAKDGLRMLQKKYGKKIDVFTLPYNYGLGLIRNKMESEYGKLIDAWKKKDDTKRDT